MIPSVWEKPPAFFTTVFAVLASWKDRRLPPASPRGKREWGGGLISRGRDLPGRPIRPPIRVPARGRIRNPARCMARSRPALRFARAQAANTGRQVQLSFEEKGADGVSVAMG